MTLKSAVGVVELQRIHSKWNNGTFFFISKWGNLPNRCLSKAEALDRCKDKSRSFLHGGSLKTMVVVVVTGGGHEVPQTIGC